MYNVKHRYAVHLKSGHRLFSSLTKVMLKEKASTVSTIKEIVLLYCRRFSSFVFVVMIQHRKTACNRNH